MAEFESAAFSALCMGQKFSSRIPELFWCVRQVEVAGHDHSPGMAAQLCAYAICPGQLHQQGAGAAQSML